MAQQIFLKNGVTGEPVEALLFEKVSDEQLANWLATWPPAIDAAKQVFLKKNIPKEKWPQDAHWKWDHKITQTRGILAYESYCIARGDRIDGLMLVSLTKTSRMPARLGQELVYINFVATAPWNRSSLVAAPEVRGVGSIFVNVAIQLSDAQGFKGRIGLHSLPGAYDFYANESK
jgi:hypothetical protein